MIESNDDIRYDDTKEEAKLQSAWCRATETLGSIFWRTSLGWMCTRLQDKQVKFQWGAYGTPFLCKSKLKLIRKSARIAWFWWRSFIVCVQSSFLSLNMPSSILSFPLNYVISLPTIETEQCVWRTPLYPINYTLMVNNTSNTLRHPTAA